MSAMKYFGLGIDRDVACSTNYAYFNEGYDGTNQDTNGSFVLCFLLKVYMIMMTNIEVVYH